jgi:hypothetical protein
MMEDLDLRDGDVNSISQVGKGTPSCKVGNVHSYLIIHRRSIGHDKADLVGGYRGDGDGKVTLKVGNHLFKLQVRDVKNENVEVLRTPFGFHTYHVLEKVKGV